MIVDTSALIAMLTEEPGSEAIAVALSDERVVLPAPVILEFMSVAGGSRFSFRPEAEDTVERLLKAGARVAAWENLHADIATQALWRYGKGNGRGGKLNMIDLMVYAVAKSYDQPLLFAGRDFLTTDVLVHSASRTDV